MSQSEFMTTFAAELADLVAAHPGRAEARVLADAFALHRRHGESVRTVATKAVSENAAEVIDQSIPKDSLLAILLNSATDADRMETSFVPPQIARPGGAQSLPVDGAPAVFPLRVVVLAEGKRPMLRINGLGEFKGAHLKLVLILRSYHQEDCATPLDPADHRYIAAGALGSKNTVWQHAKRCRQGFALRYEAVMAIVPPSHILIEGEKQLGYRLDPDARFVADRSP
jgi:hypothetical protein